MKQITLQQLRNVLIDGKFPAETVNVEGVSFEFILTDADISLCNNIADCIDFLSKVIVCRVRDTVVPITDLPSVYFHPLQIAYSKFQYVTLSALLQAVTDFTKSSESHGLWFAYIHSDSSCVLSISDKLNIVQRRWVAYHAMTDKKERIERVIDIFEATKPWLNYDMYKALKEHADNEGMMRENAFYGDTAYDEELREKARKAAHPEVDSDSDIIVVEEEG